jgi:hypothetical protein
MHLKRSVRQRGSGSLLDVDLLTIRKSTSLIVNQKISLRLWTSTLTQP